MQYKPHSLISGVPSGVLHGELTENKVSKLDLTYMYIAAYRPADFLIMDI